jgi:hypothetical protein
MRAPFPKPGVIDLRTAALVYAFLMREMREMRKMGRGAGSLSGSSNSEEASPKIKGKLD